MSQNGSMWASLWTALVRIVGRLLSFSWTRPSAWWRSKRSAYVAALVARDDARRLLTRDQQRITGRRYKAVLIEERPVSFFERSGVRVVGLIMLVAFISGFSAGAYHTVMMRRHLAHDTNLVKAEVEKFEECKDALERLAARHYDGATYEEIVTLMRDLDRQRKVN